MLEEAVDERLRRHPGLAAVPRGDADLTLVDGKRAHACIPQRAFRSAVAVVLPASGVNLALHNLR